MHKIGSLARLHAWYLSAWNTHGPWFVWEYGHSPVSLPSHFPSNLYHLQSYSFRLLLLDPPLGRPSDMINRSQLVWTQRQRLFTTFPKSNEYAFIYSKFEFRLTYMLPRDLTWIISLYALLGADVTSTRDSSYNIKWLNSSKTIRQKSEPLPSLLEWNKNDPKPAIQSTSQSTS